MSENNRTSGPSRRLFLSSPAALAAIPTGPVERPAPISGRVFGIWTNEREDLVLSGRDRYHMKSAEHGGPVLKFKRGELPAPGDKVVIHLTADAMVSRGLDNHRPRTRIILRVAVLPANFELRERQGELVITQDEPCGRRAAGLGSGWWLTTKSDRLTLDEMPLVPAPPPVPVAAEDVLGPQYFDPTYSEQLISENME